MEQKRNQNYLQNGQSHRETSDRPDRPDSQNRDSHEIIINTTGRNNCGGRCLIHVHMKDASVSYDGRRGILGSHLPFGSTKRAWNFRSLGHGDVNFEEIIRELNAMQYTGPLSIEWEDNGMDRIFGLKEAISFVRRINFPPSEIEFDAAIKTD